MTHNAADIIQAALAEGAKVVTLKDIKVLRAGTWFASTGLTTVTTEDLEDMVKASQDVDIDQAVLKLGHKDPINDAVLRDGAPALGHWTNLRVDGEYLVADLEDIPVPLAQVMPHAYKRRSAEIAWRVSTPGGNKYRAALTGVVLLGKFAPAAKGLGDPIESVEDLYKLYGVTGPEVEEKVASFSAGSVSSLSQGDDLAAVNLDALRTAWRRANPQPDGPGDSELLHRWVRETWLNTGSPGGYLIIEGGNLEADELERVPWAVDDEGEFTFGTPEKVKVSYTPAALTGRQAILGQFAAKKLDATTTETALSAIAPASGAIPGAVSGGNPSDSPASPDNDPKSTPKEALTMDEKRIGELLKEEDEAKAVDLFKKLRAEGETAPEGETNPDGTPKAPEEAPKVEAEGDKVLEGAGASLSDGVTVKDGVVMLTEGVWSEVTKGLEAGKFAAELLRAQDVEKTLQTALRDGKIAPEPKEKEAWKGRLEKDLEGTKALLSSLQPRFNTVEVGDDLADETELSESEDKAMDAFMESTFGIELTDQGGN